MANLYKAPTQNFVSTTLDGAINDTVTTISLTDSTGLQAPGYVVIDRQDSSGADTPSAREVVSFTGISGNDLTGCTRGADNSTARSHSNGATVEATFTAGMWNNRMVVANNEPFQARNAAGTEKNILNKNTSDQTTIGENNVRATRYVPISPVTIKTWDGGGSETWTDLDVTTNTSARAYSAKISVNIYSDNTTTATRADFRKNGASIAYHSVYAGATNSERGSSCFDIETDTGQVFEYLVNANAGSFYGHILVVGYDEYVD